MKIVSRVFERNGRGSIEMIPEEPEDLWVAYNLISKGDTARAISIRNVASESASGIKIVRRAKLNLEIKVEFIEYDKDGSGLRLRGKNVSPNEYVKIGAYLTLIIDVKRAFVLTKDMWDTLAVDAIEQASNHVASADLAVALMQEGLAHIILIGKTATTTCSRIEASIPRKHGQGIAAYEAALSKFLEKVIQAFVKYVNFDVVRCAVIASPGFTRSQFHKQLLLEAERKQLTPIIKNKSRLLLVHTTSGYKHSLREVINSPGVMHLIKDTKAALEMTALNDFFEMLAKNSACACYGPKHVEVAHERMAIHTLLITDGLLRNADIPTRKKYIDLVSSVKNCGGTSLIFSSMHVSGEQLAQLTGIAAILRFPLEELDDIEM